MTAQKLEDLLNSLPFRPFQIFLPSGQSVPVPARDFAPITPSGRTLVVLGENESETVVDVTLIERVEMNAAS
jgi:hypothetical protein